MELLIRSGFPKLEYFPYVVLPYGTTIICHEHGVVLETGLFVIATAIGNNLYYLHRRICGCGKEHVHCVGTLDGEEVEAQLREKVFAPLGFSVSCAEGHASSVPMLFETKYDVDVFLDPFREHNISVLDSGNARLKIASDPLRLPMFKS